MLVWTSARRVAHAAATVPAQWVSGRAFFSTIQDEFAKKLALGKTLPPLQDNMKKLEMYALFKQANSGKNTTPKPGMLDFVGKAKWEAWTKLGDMSQEEAMQKYIDIIDELAKQSGVGAPAGEASQAAAAPSSTTGDLVVTTSENGLLTIQLNRPKVYNALHKDMYDGIVQVLEASKNQDNIKAVLLKSTGAMFSSGNDLAMFTANPEGKSFEELAEYGAKILEPFVNAFLTYPKPIVVAVQGPAVGISVTILALCDLVYLSDKATLQTPFTALGQSPEACSSTLFPLIMGKTQANAMLLLGEKITAQEAVSSGLATAVFSAAEFDKKVNSKVEMLLSRYPHSMRQSKALIQAPMLQQLQQVNRNECNVLKKLWIGPECMDAILKFQNRKN